MGIKRLARRRFPTSQSILRTILSVFQYHRPTWLSASSYRRRNVPCSKCIGICLFVCYFVDEMLFFQDDPLGLYLVPELDISAFT